MCPFDVETLAGRGEKVTVKIVAAKDNEIDIRLVGHAEHCRARGMNARRHSSAIERVQSIGATHHLQCATSQTLANDLRKRFANPLDAGSFRNIFKGGDKNYFLSVPR